MPKIFVFTNTSDFEIESSTCVSAAKFINLSGLKYSKSSKIFLSFRIFNFLNSYFHALNSNLF